MASSTTSAATSSSTESDNLRTLYINNINEKVKKDMCKRMLNMLFSQYGKVQKITIRTGIKMRGQAWIAFDNIDAAANAMKGKQGFNFYGKPLKISYSKSDTLLKKSGDSENSNKKRARDDDDIHHDGLKALKSA